MRENKNEDIKWGWVVIVDYRYDIVYSLISL